MFFDKKKFRVVIIDYPIYAFEDKVCANIFGKALHMKHTGYIATYGEKILPMDKTDFFSTHVMLCEENADDFIPIFAYKATPYDRCLFYDMELPGITMTKSDGDPSCTKRIYEIISTLKDPSQLSFDSSWAQNLDYRFSNNPELKNVLREIMMMVIVKHHEEFNIPHMMTIGVLKVKTDQFFERIGLRKINDKSNFNLKSLANTEIALFHSTTFSDEALLMAQKYKDLWDNRLMINGLERKTLIKTAA